MASESANDRQGTLGRTACSVKCLLKRSGSFLLDDGIYAKADDARSSIVRVIPHASLQKARLLLGLLTLNQQRLQGRV